MSRWYTIFGPSDWPGVTLETGNTKIDGTYFNVLTDQSVQLAAESYMWLVAKSGIRLITPGYVDASGLRAKNLLVENFSRINSAGEAVDFYDGEIGGLMYKYDSNTIASDDTLVVNTGIGKVTFPAGSTNSPVYVSDGGDEGTPTKELSTFSNIEFVPEKTITVGDTTTTEPAEVNITDANFYTSNITIGDGGDSYKGTILTHQGAGLPATWAVAEYLKAEGVLWNRYPKRAVRIEDSRVIFYLTKPEWALIGDPDDYLGFNAEKLAEEIGVGDTLKLINAETLEAEYAKPAYSVTFAAIDNDPDTTIIDLFEQVEILDNGVTYQGLALRICPNATINGDTAYVNGYAFSVKKGGYLSMQLEPEATDAWGCGDPPFTDTPYTFKPSTSANISIRPDVHTAFNMLAENIDFVVYGKRNVDYGNYDPALFDVDPISKIPVGLTPGFKVDANVENAALGTFVSGVTYEKYLDREKTIPTGYIVDENAKICINTNTPYSINSIVSGVGFLTHYADVTIPGTMYASGIIAEDIMLRPEPVADGSGKYVTNSLLTINSVGQVVSRRPSQNPTVPDKPRNVTLQVIGNDEFSIRWIPGDNGGTEIVNYIIEFSVNDGNTWTVVDESQILRGSSNQTSCTIIGLSTSLIYQFRVKAQNGIGIGDPSETSAASVPNNNLPQAIKNLTETRSFGATTSDISLSWDIPDSAGTSAINGYLIEESDNNGSTWIYYNTTENLITETSEIIYGLDPTKDYLYRIYPINDTGIGTYNFIRSTGIATEEVIQEDLDVLGNWDFGSILFTGVCQL